MNGESERCEWALSGPTHFHLAAAVGEVLASAGLRRQRDRIMIPHVLDFALTEQRIHRIVQWQPGPRVLIVLVVLVVPPRNGRAPLEGMDTCLERRMVDRDGRGAEARRSSVLSTILMRQPQATQSICAA